MIIKTKTGKRVELISTGTRKILRNMLKIEQGNNRIAGTLQKMQIAHNPKLARLYEQANKRSGRARQRWLDRISMECG